MDTSEEQMKDARRVLEKIPDPQSVFSNFLKTEETQDDNEVQNPKLKYSKDENEFTKLKLSFIEAQTGADMIDFLFNKPPEEWPSIDKENTKESFGQVKQDLKSAKDDVENLEEKLCSLIDNAQENVQKLERMKKEAEDVLCNVEMKKTKLESLKAMHEQSLEGLDCNTMEGVDLPDKLQKQRDALQTTEMALQRCDLLLTEHKRAISRLQEKCCLAEALQKELQQTVKTLAQRRVEQDLGTKENLEWFQKSLQAIRQATGISNIRVQDQTMTLDLVCEGSASVVKVELQMTFKCTPDGQSKLTSARLGQEMLDCSDAISEAIDLNDPVLLIQEIKRRLNNHAPVLQEVEKLRHEYAVDYVHEERKLMAMLGSSGQIVCTLTVDGDYPSRGSARLTKIEGNGHHKDITEYKPPTEKPTMSDWLKYLQEEL